MTSGTLFAGVLGASAAAADSTERPNTITIDGSEDWVKSTYEFSVSGSVVEFDDGTTVERHDSMGEDSASGAVHRDLDTYRFSGNLMYLDIDGPATVSVEYGDDPGVGASRLEIVASDERAIEYEFTTTERATRVTTNGSNSTDASDSVAQNDDGSWTVSGDTAYGQGDTWDFWGDVTDFAPMKGEFTLFLDGEEITPYELTGEEPPEERTHSYSFEGTGSEYADYYLEVEEGGNMIASMVDGAVIEEEFHWISNDGTKAAGRVDPGERHAYEFDTLVLDVTIDGSADAYVNGSPSNLDWYPQPGATGDSWKGGFPWQNEDDGNDDEPTDDREHSYSFEGSGSEPADYFLEVEDGGNMIASTVDGAAIEEEFHWISDDGTKAAGRVDPGERHAYAFDTLVLDVTIEGRADAYVNGSPSNLDRYPQPGATGDGWKSGFPWQDEDDGDDGNDGSETSEDGPIGGGDGYADVVTESDATTVVSSASELASALGSASSGDVVFVDPSAEIDITNTTGVGISDGVTLASNRGVNGSSGALLYTTTDTHPNFEMYGNSRITGLEIRGSHPGDDTSGTWYGQAIKTNGPAEIDNCEIHGWGKAAIECAGSSGGSAHVHHNHLHHNNQIGYGYAVSMISSGGVPTIEYNYFYYNRHSVASDGEASGYTLRYNHFGPTEVMWPIDTHSPGCSTLEIHNNVVEVVDRAYDNNRAASIELDSPPSNSAEIYNNWFFNSRAPDPNDPGCQGPDRSGPARAG